MHTFNVGEQVIVQYGEWQGNKGQVVETQPAEVYKVRLADGSLLFFCRASLLAEPARRPTRTPATVAVGKPSRN